MLTARAAGIVLRNISQVDSFKAQWLEEYFTQVRCAGPTGIIERSELARQHVNMMPCTWP